MYKLIVLVIIACAVVHHVRGECCPVVQRHITKKSMCGDGQPLPEGMFCGKGACNIFGCNCDGGCLEHRSEGRRTYTRTGKQCITDCVLGKRFNFETYYWCHYAGFSQLWDYCSPRPDFQHNYTVRGERCSGACRRDGDHYFCKTGHEWDFCGATEEVENYKEVYEYYFPE